ncbi:MAG: hypothetical protein APR62_13540 [Smithella sp. SDB]|nr:MAG: hypothetical protein APR62_13540 [Smithella sp. SDB]
MKNKNTKICFISSSGGHYEQLKMLKPLAEKYTAIWITEKTHYQDRADYYLLQTGSKDILFPFKMTYNLFKSFIIFAKFRPDYIISTGTMVAFPMAYLAKIFRKKLIYIETFARIKDGTRTGKIMYEKADLFIIQWEDLKSVYPNAIYGGSIY